MIKRYKTIEQVWNDIEKGIEIFWGNESYHLTLVPSGPNNTQYTNKNGQLLRVTCISNYFGSLLNESELNALFSK